MKEFNVTYCADGITSVTTVKAKNKNDALMAFLKELSEKGNNPRNLDVSISAS